MKWDVDGNKYVDYFGGHGSLILGHCHPTVMAAVHAALERGTHFGACHELEVRWAELITQMVPSAERVRFTSSGTEATLMALRLARFNATMTGPSEQPTYAYNFFTGVPAPAGAGLALFPLFVGLEAKKLHWGALFTAVNYPLFDAVMLCGVALLLVSTLPVWSFKNFKIRAEYVLPLLLGVCGFVAVLVADPWAALAAAGLIYLVMLPFSRRSFHKLKADAEALQEDIPDETAPDGAPMT